MQAPLAAPANNGSGLVRVSPTGGVKLQGGWRKHSRENMRVCAAESSNIGIHVILYRYRRPTTGGVKLQGV